MCTRGYLGWERRLDADEELWKFGLFLALLRRTRIQSKTRIFPNLTLDKMARS